MHDSAFGIALHCALRPDDVRIIGFRRRLAFVA